MTKQQKPETHYQDHSLDSVSTAVHQDPRASDVGAAGTLRRTEATKKVKPDTVDHGIGRVLKEVHDQIQDHGGDPADPKAHKDDALEDVSSSGVTHR